MDGTVEGAEEFVELYNTTGAAVDISGWELWEDGSSAVFTFPPATSIPAGGYVVVLDDGGSNSGLPSNYYVSTALSLSNASDNVYLVDPSDNFIEVRYGSTDEPDSNDFLVSEPGFTQVGTREYAGAEDDALSVQRSPNGAATWELQTPTPSAEAAVTVSQTVDDTEGWRLLSAPVSGLTVTDLAEINLVQGIAAGTTNPAQYASADANLFTTYTGGGSSTSYTAPADTDEGLMLGRGFWWYWFDADAGPFPGGTSQGFELSTFVLSASGPAATADVAETFSPSLDRFYMIGNPFATDFDLGGLSTTVGSFSTSFFAYDPSAASGAGAYVTLADTDALAPWQGAFGQINESGIPSSPRTITYAVASAGGSGATFYGREAAAEQIDLRLDGTLASGAPVGDRTARLRLLGDAEIGWDRHDLSELAPPTTEVALLALVGERDGEAERQGVLSLPTTLSGTQTVPVAFTASGDGAFVISWDAATLPSGWTATLRDTETGTEADLAAEGTLAFDADATDWVNRFEILLAAASVSTEGGADAETVVGDVFPNPTAGAARLGVRLGEAQRVTATVYDAIGRQVAVAFDGDLGAGAQSLALDTEAFTPGVYVVRVAGETFTESRRLVVTR